MPSYPPAIISFEDCCRAFSNGYMLLRRFTTYNKDLLDVKVFIIEFEDPPFSGKHFRPDDPSLRDLQEIWQYLKTGGATIVAHELRNHNEQLFEIHVSNNALYYQRPRYNPPRILPKLDTAKPKPKPKVIKKIQTEPEIGYRDFTFLTKGNIDRPMLLSRNSIPWPRYEPMVATCNGDPFAKHDAPALDCQCGIYAYDKPSHPDMKSDAKIWGELALWGEVFICETGFRAQYAYPQTLFILDVGTKLVRTFRDNLEREYGVPVHLVEKREGKKASEIMQDMIDNFTSGQL